METSLIALCLGLITLLSGGLIAIRGLRNAPEGFEDSEGFHRVVTAQERAEQFAAENASNGAGLGLPV